MKTFLAVFFGILAAAAVIAGIVGVIRLVEQEQRATQVRREIPVLRVRTINTACITYQATYDRYPETLGQLGPSPGGGGSYSAEHAGFIDEVFASGKVGGYTFSYCPTKRDRRGRVVGYAVTATRDPVSTWAIRNYFTDESGVIRSTLENRPATSGDPAVGG